jgi:hypothetical protein
VKGEVLDGFIPRPERLQLMRRVWARPGRS